MYLEQYPVGMEVWERFWGVVRGTWECRTGIEGVRSVPLEERIVISMGEKELHMMSISILCDCHSLGISGSALILVEARLDGLL